MKEIYNGPAINVGDKILIGKKPDTYCSNLSGLNGLDKVSYPYIVEVKAVEDYNSSIIDNTYAFKCQNEYGWHFNPDIMEIQKSSNKFEKDDYVIAESYKGDKNYGNIGGWLYQNEIVQLGGKHWGRQSEKEINNGKNVFAITKKYPQGGGTAHSTEGIFTFRHPTFKELLDHLFVDNGKITIKGTPETKGEIIRLLIKEGFSMFGGLGNDTHCNFRITRNPDQYQTTAETEDIHVKNIFKYLNNTNYEVPRQTPTEFRNSGESRVATPCRTYQITSASRLVGKSANFSSSRKGVNGIRIQPRLLSGKDC